MNQMPLLSLGSTGSEVERLQRDLAILGYKLEATGTFDAETETTVLQFQKDRDLTTDGVVGPQTGRALGAALA